METAVFGGGCFWCTEAVFKSLKGIISVMPGYAGGKLLAGGRKPTYEEVCNGTTGHAEVVRVEFNPNQISYRDLLTVFFGTHDPTTLNQQGADIGTQYRSTILYTTESQKHESQSFIKEINESNAMGAPIVTTVEPLSQFYEAEDYHKDYYNKNPGNPYCAVVINPKLKKVQEHFVQLLSRTEQ